VTCAGFADRSELEKMTHPRSESVMKKSRYSDEQIVRILLVADKDAIGKVAGHGCVSRTV
jgi:hypothetical protein